MEIYVITNDHNDDIEYVGTNLEEANDYLEIPFLRDQHYSLSIWEDGRLLNECIKNKIKKEEVAIKIKNMSELIELTAKLPAWYRTRAMKFIGEVASGGHIDTAIDGIKYLFEYNGMDELAELVDIKIEQC